MNRKAIFITLLMLVVFMAMLSATESRLMALGNAQGFVRDNTDIFYYPGTLNQYMSQANAELRAQGFENSWSIGANMPISKFGFGVYLNRSTGIYLDALLNNHSDYSTGDLDISKKIQFLMSLNDNIGLGFAMAMDSKSIPAPSDMDKDVSMSAFYLGFNGGLSTERMDLGANIDIPMAGVSNEDTKEEEALFGIGIGLNGRYFLKDTPNVKYFALGDLGFNSTGNVYKADDDADELTYGEGEVMFDLGLGLNYCPAEKSTLIFGLYPLKIYSHTDITPNASDNEESDTDTDTFIYVPEYKIAFETQLTSWLTGRVGACQDYYFSNHTVKIHDQDAVSSGDYSSNFNAELGFGINFKRFTMDGVISDAILFDGPDFIGGTGPGVSTKLSIGYDFN